MESLFDEPQIPNPKSRASVLNPVSRLCQVCVHAPLGRKLFTYQIPESVSGLIPGDAVLVPFGGREILGWVVRVDVAPEEIEGLAETKYVQEKIDGAGIHEEDMRLCEKLLEWYGSNFSDILAMFVPPEAPKLVRRIERVTADLITNLSKPGSASPTLQLPMPLTSAARALAAVVDDAGGTLEMRKAEKGLSSPYPPPVLRLACRELVSSGAFTIKTSPVVSRPGRKKFLGPADITEGTTLTEPQKKIIAVALRHPFRFGAAELAKLAHARPADVKALVRNQMLLEQTSRVWKTPLERANVAMLQNDPSRTATPSQARAIAQINRAIESGTPEFFLLYGPTASGKTFVYEAAARSSLSLGKQVLLMVPEIALTKPLLDRIRKTIPETMAVVHSRQTRAERRDERQRCESGEARLLVGPRSAAFVPLPDLGLVIIDECHDAGYKQAEPPFLDARRVVEEKCLLKSAPLVMGSATPTVEQLHVCDGSAPPAPQVPASRISASGASSVGVSDSDLTPADGRRTMDAGRTYRRLDLTEFPTRPARPRVSIVDLSKSRLPRTAYPQAQMYHRCFLSPELREALRETLEKKESAVLLLNRRGFAPLVLCPACGFSVRCDACLLGMTFHSQDRRMICHGCGNLEAPPVMCPGCGYTPLGYMGVGTERVVEACQKCFPAARIARLDQDVMRKSRREAFEILEDLKNGKVDILIGTQMIAKGLDVPRVTLAAVLLADVGLHLPDYRARERTFQLLAQMIGRSGRHSTTGRALVQTFLPASSPVVYGAGEEMDRFFQEERELRRQGSWPPFVRLVRVLVQSPNAPRALQVIRQIHLFLTEHSGIKDIKISTPLPAPRPKWNGEYRFQICLRLPPDTALPPGLADEIQRRYRGKQSKIVVEPDPISIL